MYQEGYVVTLNREKLHGEGEDAVKLSQGVCGLVMRTTRKGDGNHQYVVDFGAYGQWYCSHRELDGDDTEGWDQDPVAERPLGNGTVTWTNALRNPSEEDNNEDEEEDSETPQSPARNTLEYTVRIDEEPRDHKEDEESGALDVEADIRRRMKELGAGIE